MVWYLVLHYQIILTSLLHHVHTFSKGHMYYAHGQFWSWACVAVLAGGLINGELANW